MKLLRFAAVTIILVGLGLAAQSVQAQVVHGFDLSWGTVTATPTPTYNVYRSSVSGGPYTKIAPNLTATTYTDNGLPACTTYYYVVTAQNINGESVNSNEVSGTTLGCPTPPAPGNLRLTPH